MYFGQLISRGVVFAQVAFWCVGVVPCRPDPTEPKALPLDKSIRAAKEVGADGLDVNCRSPIDREYLDTVRQAGMELHTWTVNDAERAKELARVGVDSITTDRPGWLRQQLGDDP